MNKKNLILKAVIAMLAFGGLGAVSNSAHAMDLNDDFDYSENGVLNTKVKDANRYEYRDETLAEHQESVIQLILKKVNGAKEGLVHRIANRRGYNYFKFQPKYKNFIEAGKFNAGKFFEADKRFNEGLAEDIGWEDSRVEDIVRNFVYEKGIYSFDFNKKTCQKLYEELEERIINSVANIVPYDSAKLSSENFNFEMNRQGVVKESPKVSEPHGNMISGGSKFAHNDLSSNLTLEHNTSEEFRAGNNYTPKYVRNRFGFGRVREAIDRGGKLLRSLYEASLDDLRKEKPNSHKLSDEENEVLLETLRQAQNVIREAKAFGETITDPDDRWKYGKALELVVLEDVNERLGYSGFKDMVILNKTIDNELGVSGDVTKFIDFFCKPTDDVIKNIDNFNI